MKRIYILTVFLLAAALIFSGCTTVFSAGLTPRLGALELDPAADAKGEVAAPARAGEAAPAAAPAIAGEDAPAIAATLDPAEALQQIQGTFEQIYTLVNPSVVNIQVMTRGGSGPAAFSQGGSLGSGFVWDEEGHIVTNNHVIDGASAIRVTFADGMTVEAEIVGQDPNADLAVIKVDPRSVDLQPVALADSSQVKVGQLAIAIGNPYGLSGTMTEGIISALQRTLPVSSDSRSGLATGSYTIPDIIQTDAAINPGNSGGVLVNMQGAVIGVPTAITSASNSNSGIGFVIPSNIVSRIVPVLISDGEYAHPRIGISGVTLSAEFAQAMDLDANQKGVLVVSVAEGGPADEAGLRGSTAQDESALPVGGDVITAIDGQAVTRFEELTSYLYNNAEVGQKVTLTILRGGSEQSVEVTLGTME